MTLRAYLSRSLGGGSSEGFLVLHIIWRRATPGMSPDTHLAKNSNRRRFISSALKHMHGYTKASTGVVAPKVICKYDVHCYSRYHHAEEVVGTHGSGLSLYQSGEVFLSYAPTKLFSRIKKNCSRQAFFIPVCVW